MLKFIEPIDGVILHTIDGDKGAVACTLSGDAVSVNGICCTHRNGRAYASVEVPVGPSVLTARSDAGETVSIRIERVQTRHKLFRVSVDDCIWFLQNIAARRYHSIFEDPLMAMFKRLHDEYGAAFHLNIYFECPERGGFNLTQFPDNYLGEWQENKHWLRLSFHARANLPNWPYRAAGYDRVYADCSDVMREIRRFAGEMGAITTLHFAATPPEGIQALYDCGVRALLGDFSYDGKGREQLGYNAMHAQFEAVRKYGFWRDHTSNMVYFPCDIVLNLMTPQEIPQEMSRMAREWPGRNFLDILIHEQYFYPEYKDYEPDYEQRIRAGIEWCLQNGYAPGLASEALGWE